MQHEKTSVLEIPDFGGKSKPATQTTASAIGRIIAKILLQYAFMGAVLFVAAGTLHWVRAWIYLAVALTSFAVNAAVVVPRNPGLILERHKKRQDTKSFDKVITGVVTLVTVGIWIVAGLDAARFHGSSLPFVSLFPGILVHLAGMGIIGWCMITNPFLEKTVRIQEDRSQRVVMTGPYAIVRHPMYMGMILLSLGYPLILGSAWTFVPVAIHTVVFITRTALEDATLRRELTGYEDYTQRTQYRLVPGIW